MQMAYSAYAYRLGGKQVAIAQHTGSECVRPEMCWNRAALLDSEVCASLTSSGNSLRRMDMKFSTLLSSNL